MLSPPLPVQSPIHRLTDDALGHVMEHLDTRSLARAVQTCRRWKGVAEDTGQWLVQLKRVCPQGRLPQVQPPQKRLDPELLRQRLCEEIRVVRNLRRSAYRSTRLDGVAPQVPTLALNATGDAVVAPSPGGLGTWSVAQPSTPVVDATVPPGVIVAQSSDASTVACEVRRADRTRHLAVVRGGDVVRTWQLPVAQPVRVTLSPTGAVGAIAMGDGSLWVGRVDQDDTLQCASGPSHATIPHTAISADGRYLGAVMYADSAVRVWDLQNAMAMREVRDVRALEVAFVGDGSTLGVLGYGGRLYTADLTKPSLTLERLVPMPRKALAYCPRALQFSADGHWLFLIAGRYVWTWNLLDPEERPFRIRPTHTLSEMPTALAVSADARRLLVEIESDPSLPVATRLEVWDFAG